MFGFKLNIMENLLTSVISNLGKAIFKSLFYLVLISFFWQVSFLICKPDFLKQEYYIQIPLYISLSVMWFISYYVIVFFIELNFSFYSKFFFSRLKNVRVDAYIIISFMFKSVYLLIAYIYSFSFIDYLFGVTITSIAIFIVLILLFIILKHLRLKKLKRLKMKNQSLYKPQD